MFVKKVVPCSLYDIQGMQDWLDEMALQGLFFKEFAKHQDWAVFEVGDPQPVRYRLDPVGKSAGRGREREEPYAEMGWQFVDCIRGLYYIFSCGDPDAPELHSDPATLGYALNNAIQKQIRFWGKMTLVLILFVGAPLFLSWKHLDKSVIFVEEPRQLFLLALNLQLFLIVLPIDWLQIRRLIKTRRLLEQGLPMEAGRRWRPRVLKIYFGVFVPLLLLAFFAIPSYSPEVYGLGKVELSHPWPTLAQLEEAGPRPLEVEPEVDGYVKVNSSWLVPVQEYASIDWQGETFHPETGGIATLHRPYSLWMGIQYDRARSPRAAEKAFQIELEDAAETLENWAKWTGHAYHIDGSTGLHPRDWPGLDRLEVAQYTQSGQDAWTFAALRGNDVLVVTYAGFARWEDCLPLFLAALDQ